MEKFHVVKSKLMVDHFNFTAKAHHLVTNFTKHNLYSLKNLAPHNSTENIQVDGRDKHMTRWHNGKEDQTVWVVLPFSYYPPSVIRLFPVWQCLVLFYFAELKECETLRLYGLWRQNPEKTFLVQIILITNHPTSAA